MKLKGCLLRFDTVDNLGIKFAKDCKINIPEVIPVKIGFGVDEGKIIGGLSSIDKSDEVINIEMDIIAQQDMMDAIKEVIKDTDLYNGGYYRIDEEHSENGVRVIDKMKLLHNGIFLDDVYGDKSLRLEVVKDD